MKGIFLRSYATLALVAIVAVAATQLLIAYQVRGTLEERADEALHARIELVRERLARGDTRWSDALDDAFMPPPPPGGRDTPPGRGRDAGPFPHGLGPVRVVPIETLGLPSDDRAALNNDAIVRFRRDGGRVLAARIDDTRAVIVGPGRPVLPRIMVVHQAITLCTMLLVIGLGLWWLQRPIEARLSRVAHAAGRWTAGERGARSGVAGDDPVGKVGEQFDAMADAIAELLARREELLRSVSHELRTPLARLTLLQEQASESDDPEAKAQAVARMQRSIHEMTELVEELLAFARIDGRALGEPVAVDLLGVARRAAESVDQATPEVRVVGDAAMAWGDTRDLERAVDNLVRNGVAHATSRVVVTVGGMATEATLDVDDDGPGVAPADRARIFEPFVRLDERAARRGSGLGLAIVERAVTRMGGTVRCETSPLGGARFRITLRAAPSHDPTRPRTG